MPRALIILLFASVAHASPATDLAEARNAFKAKDCSSAMKTLNFLLYPKEKLGSADDLAEAHTLLGACRCDSGDKDGAGDEFNKVLDLQPDRRLSDLLFSSCAIRSFDEVRAARELKAKQDAELRKAAEARLAYEKALQNLVAYREQSYGLNFVPFGAGQFIQHRYLVGGLVLGGEVATLGVSAGIWLYLAGKYGITSNNVPLADGPTVRHLQELEVGAGIAFFAIYGYGIVDALLHWQPRVQVPPDETLLKLKKTTLRDRIHVGPIATTNGGFGIGVAWEND